MLEIINETDTSVSIKINETIEMLNIVLYKDAIEPIMEKNKDIIFFMQNVDYIDSTGVGFLLGILKRQRAKNNKVILGNVSPAVKNILQISSLYSMFDVEEDNNVNI